MRQFQSSQQYAIEQAKLMQGGMTGMLGTVCNSALVQTRFPQQAPFRHYPADHGTMRQPFDQFARQPFDQLAGQPFDQLAGHAGHALQCHPQIGGNSPVPQHLCPGSSCSGKLKVRPDSRELFCPECGYKDIYFSCSECEHAGRHDQMKGINVITGKLTKVF